MRPVVRQVLAEIARTGDAPAEVSPVENLSPLLSSAGVARRTVHTCRLKRPRLWLVLVDQIGLGASTREAELIAEHVEVDHEWDRLLLLSPLDYTQAVEVKSSRAAA